MRQASGVLAILALAGGLAASQEAAPPSEVALAFKASGFKTKFPRLQLSGGARTLPDGTQLKITLHRLEEGWVHGGRLEGFYAAAGSGRADVHDRKFECPMGLAGPGKVLVQVDYLDEMQRQEISDALKRKLPVKRWTFEFLCWGDELAPELGPRLKEFSELAAAALAMLRRFEEAVATQDGWLAQGKEIERDNARLLAKVNASPLKPYYPAALSQIGAALQGLASASRGLKFENGKLAGITDYHADDRPAETHRKEPLNTANLKRYCEEASALAGREFCLWIVKDLRRTAGTLNAAFLPALQETKKANPGVAPFADRLEKAGLADLDALETAIRGGGAVKPSPPGN
jgi:hypothetical protein